MSVDVPVNLAASVHQKLLNKARKDSRPFNELLQYYTMERFLYRFSRSIHAEKFILKGALVLWGWQAPLRRPTRDIDMLGITSNEINSVIRIVEEICMTVVDPDGLVFDMNTLRGEKITEDADYEGVRVRFSGFLGNARIPMQIDIGFGDVIIPSPEDIEINSILDYQKFSLRCYSKESFIAEKFEAMIKLGEMNSRMKDFYDIWLLSRQYDFSCHSLSLAMKETLSNRKTSLPEIVMAFTPEFVEIKSGQWNAFLKGLGEINVAPDFQEAVQQILSFLGPVCDILKKDQIFIRDWIAPGPWK